MKIAVMSVVGALIGLAYSGSAVGQISESDAYPNKPIRIVVPAAPAGVNDILARLIGQKLTDRFGKAVIVENKPGAATMLGAEFVARSASDGYTLLIAPLGTMAVNPAVFTKVSYSPQNDFVPGAVAKVVGIRVTRSPST